jgi:hypothetical protein
MADPFDDLPPDPVIEFYKKDLGHGLDPGEPEANSRGARPEADGASALH